MAVVDLFLLYSFVKRLATPFTEWKAFKAGLIDKDGTILKKRKEMNGEEKQALGLFDTLILNLKKLLAKIPGGRTRIATFAAALFLLKEDERGVSEDELEAILDRLEIDHQNLMEGLIASGLILVEDEGGGGVPTNNTNNIANPERPLLRKVKQLARKKISGGTIAQP